MGDTLGHALLGDSLLATSNGAGSHATSLELRSAVLKSALVGHMGITSLDSLEVLLLLVAGMRSSKSCQAQNDGLVEDHGDLQVESEDKTRIIVRTQKHYRETTVEICSIAESCR